MRRILLIDDDDKLAKLLADYLRNFKYDLIPARDAKAGLAKLRGGVPDLILLDIMLPGKSGLDLLKDIRAISAVPVLMLTARGDVADKVLGLENGADDYLAKPFAMEELVARVKALLRRGGPTRPATEGASETLEHDGVRIDLDADQVAVVVTTPVLTSIGLAVRSPDQPAGL